MLLILNEKDKDLKQVSYELFKSELKCLSCNSVIPPDELHDKTLIIQGKNDFEKYDPTNKLFANHDELKPIAKCGVI